MLIDSGSTHNFVSEKVAQMLHLLVIPTGPFIVKVADGNRLQCQGRFERVQIILQGILFSLKLYSLPLIGLDFVLGIHWLEMLGSVVRMSKTSAGFEYPGLVGFLALGFT